MRSAASVDPEDLGSGRHDDLRYGRNRFSLQFAILYPAASTVTRVNARMISGHTPGSPQIAPQPVSGREVVPRRSRTFGTISRRWLVIAGDHGNSGLVYLLGTTDSTVPSTA